MPIMRKRSGFPTVAIGKFGTTNWGDTKPNGVLDVTAFVVEYDMTITGGTELITATTAPNAGANSERWDIGWGDGSYDLDNVWNSRVTNHTVSATAVSEMRFLGINGSPSKVRVEFNSQQYLTQCTKLGNFVLDSGAFYNCDNFDFASATLDNTYVAQAINTTQAFRFNSGITQGLTRLKIDFVNGTAGPGSILQGANNYLGEDLSSWNVTPSQTSSWNRWAPGINGVNLSVSGWDMSGVGNIGYGIQNTNQNADWTDVFPSGSVLSVMDNAFSNSPNFTGVGLDTWDVSNVTNFNGAFGGCDAFNGQIAGWDVSSAYIFTSMFSFSGFAVRPAMTAAIENWSLNTSATSTGSATSTAVNQLIDTGADFITDGVVIGMVVVNTSTGATSTVASVVNANTLNLNHDIFQSTLPYRVHRGISMSSMFRRNNKVTRDLGAWQMTNVQSIGGFFESRSSGDCTLNFDLSQWERSTPGDESTMAYCLDFAVCFFGGSTFMSQTNYGSIQDWDVRGAHSFRSMFAEAGTLGTNFDAFCDLSNWVLVGNGAIDMSYMFSVTSSCPTGFNSANWNTGMQNVANITGMFDRCANGNPDATQWDVGHLSVFTSFAVSSAINRDFGGWDLSSCTLLISAFATATMSEANCAATLVGWEAGGPNTGVDATNVFGTRDINETTYPTAKTAYDNLIASVGSGGYGWVITGITWVV